MAEKNRYSNEELAEFRVLILDKLEKAQSDLDLLKKTLNYQDSNDILDTSPNFKGPFAEGSTALSRDEVGKLAQRLDDFIKCLRAALIRIENKTFGICHQTGKLISKERLRAVPHTTLSIEAKNGLARVSS